MKSVLWAVLITAVLAVLLPATMGMTGHSGMRAGQAMPMHFATPSAPSANATALPIQAAAASGDLVSQGKALATQLGCAACHSTTGAAGIGPSWKGVAGKQETLADGTTVTADDAYLKESIVSPGAKVVKGFVPGLMPTTFATLPEPQIAALIEYIKSLK